MRNAPGPKTLDNTSGGQSTAECTREDLENVLLSTLQPSIGPAPTMKEDEDQRGEIPDESLQGENWPVAPEIPPHDPDSKSGYVPYLLRMRAQLKLCPDTVPIPPIRHLKMHVEADVVIGHPPRMVFLAGWAKARMNVQRNTTSATAQPNEDLPDFNALNLRTIVGKGK